MSPSTEDNLGRRRFLLHRDMAVEQSLEKIRRSPDSGWETLTPAERGRLKSVLADIWENCERRQWQEFCFSTLTKSGILRLIALEDEARTQHRPICDLHGDVEAILLSCSSESQPK